VIVVGLTLLVGITLIFWYKSELRYEGKTATEWTIEASANYPRRNQAAVQALRQMGEPAVLHLAWMAETRDSALKSKVLSLSERFPLIGEVMSSSHWYRYYAARALGDIGPPARSAAPALEAMTQDSELHLRHAASAALIRIREEPLQPYIDALRDVASTNSSDPFGVLMELGPAAKLAVPVVFEQLQSTNYRIRMRAVVLLGYVGVESEECVALLAAMLDDADEMVVHSAIGSLAHFGPLAKPVTPRIRLFLQHAESHLRTSALIFILLVVPPEEFASLQYSVHRATTDPDEGVRGLAEMVLREKTNRQ
jgi:HEAT repeat protein